MQATHLKKIAVAFAILLGLFIAWVLSPAVIHASQAGGAYKAYDDESAALTKPIGDLGISSYTTSRKQCYGSKVTAWHTETICEKFALYDHNSSALAPEQQETLQANAKKLDAILQERGWKLDRPQDNIPSVSALYEKVSAGQGGALPMHKHIGAVSCNLDIRMESPSMTNRLVDGAVIVNVNQFNCKQRISYAYPNFRSRPVHGP